MIFVLALPLFLFITTMIAKFGIKFKLKTQSLTSVKNNRCRVSLKINNRTIFPFPNSHIKIEYNNKLTGKKNIMSVSVPIHPLTEESLDFYLSSDYCGILNIKIVSAKITDYIKLFSCRIKSNSETDIYILPEENDNYGQYISKLTETEDGDIFSKHKSGDDPSEIFELKDYTSGDKINRIHWNLSMRQNKLITKYFSQSVNSSTIIVPDFFISDGFSDIYSFDTALETFFAVSSIMIENDVGFRVCYHDNLTNENVMANVTDLDTFTAIYINILKSSINHSDYNILNDISSICAGMTTLYYIGGYKSAPDYLNDFTDNTEKNIILINNLFSKPDIKYSEKLTILEIPSGRHNENIDKIMFM
jgi:hypothetical protein